MRRTKQDESGEVDWPEYLAAKQRGEPEHWRWLRNNLGKHPNLRDILRDLEEMKAKLENR
jgi:hypothetical protein